MLRWSKKYVTKTKQITCWSNAKYWQQQWQQISEGILILNNAILFSEYGLLWKSSKTQFFKISKVSSEPNNNSWLPFSHFRPDIKKQLSLELPVNCQPSHWRKRSKSHFIGYRNKISPPHIKIKNNYCSKRIWFRYFWHRGTERDSATSSKNDEWPILKCPKEENKITQNHKGDQNDIFQKDRNLHVQ